MQKYPNHLAVKQIEIEITTSHAEVKHQKINKS